MTARDRKIALAIVPLLLIVGYWFVVLGPKRKEAADASAALAKAEQKRDTATAKVGELEAAKANFRKDYRTVLQLGKAIPSSLDMPGLLVQLDKAAKGTGIRFDKISAGERAGGSQTASGGGTQPPSGASGDAAAGGAQANTGLGRGAEAAGNTVNDANAKSGAAEQGTGSAGGQSAAGTGASPTGSPAAAATAPGLDSVPLDFSFTGSFFDLADFFHQLKRFVQVANGRLVVRGRLMTVDSFTFTSGETFPKLKADVKATVYLVPRQEGVTAGASSTGPTASSPTPDSAGSSPAPASPPTATATP
jgi:Tfp pilus assembly protein PilO